jgi:hypothetical protein
VFGIWADLPIFTHGSTSNLRRREYYRIRYQGIAIFNPTHSSNLDITQRIIVFLALHGSSLYLYSPENHAMYHLSLHFTAPGSSYNIPPRFLYTAKDIPQISRSSPLLALVFTPPPTLPSQLKLIQLRQQNTLIKSPLGSGDQIIHKDSPPRDVIRLDKSTPLFRRVVVDLGAWTPQSNLSRQIQS